MNSHYPFLLTTVVFFHSSAAQEISPGLKKAYNQVLELRVDSIDFLLSMKFSSETDKIFQVYIKSLRDVLTLILIKDDHSYEKYNSREKEYLEDLEKIKTENNLIFFTKAEIRLHASLIRLKYGDQFSGAIRLIQAYKIIKSEMEKGNVPVYFNKTAGVLNILMSIVPDKYKFIMKLIGIRPELSLGIHQLEQLNDQQNLFFFESVMINALLNAYYLNDADKSWQIVDMAQNKWVESLLYLYLKGLISVKTRENDIAIESFLRCNTFDTGRYLHLVNSKFYLAESYLNKMELSLAESFYNSYIRQTINEDFIKASYFKLSLIYLFRYDFETSEYFWKKVITEGSISTEADKYAYTMVINNFHPHPDLLKARFYFDGGYYQQCLDLLKIVAKEKLTEEELLEYHYRRGRAYQLLDENFKALESFDKTFLSNFPDHYLVANAHLQSGYIQYNEGELDEAEYHFQKALKYSGELYRSSIRNEAKTGLNLIK